jgi:type II secretion system protein H
MLHTRSRISGFTLIELILVMAILVFVVAMIAPSLRGFGVGRRKSDMATLLVGVANYARTQAVTEGRAYRLNFDAQNPGFQLTVQEGATFKAIGNDYGNKVMLVDGIQLRTDIAAQPDGVHIDFHPNGRTDPAHVWFTDKLGDTIEVACESATEMFRVLKAEEMTR